MSSCCGPASRLTLTSGEPPLVAGAQTQACSPNNPSRTAVIHVSIMTTAQNAGRCHAPLATPVSTTLSNHPKSPEPLHSTSSQQGGTAASSTRSAQESSNGSPRLPVHCIACGSGMLLKADACIDRRMKVNTWRPAGQVPLLCQPEERSGEQMSARRRCDAAAAGRRRTLRG